MKSGTKILFMIFSVLFSNNILYAQTGIVIQLHQDAEIKAAIVKLKDIAEIRGGTDEVVLEKLKEVEICPAPSPGTKRIVQSSLVKYRIREFNISQENMKIKGKNCSITLKTIMVSGDELKTLALDYVKKSVKNDSIERKIEIMKVPKDFIAPVRDLILKIMPMDYGNFKGFFSIFIGVYNGERFYKKVPVFFKSKTFENVVVAIKDIKHNEIIKEEHLGIKKVETTGLKEDFIKDRRIPAGKRAKYSIKKDRIIFNSIIEIPPLINRGDMVNIKIEKGNVVLIAKGEAKKDGRLNEYIPVRIHMTKKDLIAKVEDSNTVVFEN